MPRENINYSNINIYKIVHEDIDVCDEVYVGSTTNMKIRKC